MAGWSWNSNCCILVVCDRDRLSDVSAREKRRLGLFFFFFLS